MYITAINNNNTNNNKWLFHIEKCTSIIYKCDIIYKRISYIIVISIIINKIHILLNSSKNISLKLTTATIIHNNSFINK